MAHARNCGRVAALLGPVSWTALGASAATLRAYHALGVRAVNVTRFDRFAREAVREMNRIGLAVDLSGADQDTVRRTLAVTRAPALLTRAAPEGLPDDVLALLGENGAVCMVTVTDEPAAVADVLDRVRTQAGAHCVGVSHTTVPAVGYVPLFAELLRRGWTAQELVGLAHANVTRALRETEFLSRTNRIRPHGGLTVRREEGAPKRPSSPCPPLRRAGGPSPGTSSRPPASAPGPARCGRPGSPATR